MQGRGDAGRCGEMRGDAGRGGAHDTRRFAALCTAARCARTAAAKAAAPRTWCEMRRPPGPSWSVQTGEKRALGAARGGAGRGGRGLGAGLAQA